MLFEILSLSDMEALRSENVSPALAYLLKMAQRWGIADGYMREEAVRRATLDELQNLIHCIDTVTDEELFGWLAGPASYNPNLSAEYVALTCLTMAIDSAKAKLKNVTCE